MASPRLKRVLVRAVYGAPFLFVAVWCFATMDPESIVANSKPAADSGFIEWDGGKVKLLDRFYGVDALDQALRGSMASFSPSTFGYDGVASWQFFHFLVDLGPVYTVWFLESSRAVNAWSPTYFPTLFAFLGQVVGVGTMTPVFYYLCFVFGPSTSDIARAPRLRRRCDDNTFVVPLIILFHTTVVFAMFLAPEPAARHYWTWAWQLSPLWIGLGNVAARHASHVLQPTGSSSSVGPRQMLGVMGMISFGVWIYTLLFSPHSLSTLFLPEAGAQTELVLHMRKALQADEIGVVLGVFLWLAYSFLDLRSAGLIGSVWLSCAALAVLPAIVFFGPGAAFALGWYVREGILERAGKS